MVGIKKWRTSYLLRLNLSVSTNKFENGWYILKKRWNWLLVNRWRCTILQRMCAIFIVRLTHPHVSCFFILFWVFEFLSMCFILSVYWLLDYTVGLTISMHLLRLQFGFINVINDWLRSSERIKSMYFDIFCYVVFVARGTYGMSACIT